MNNIKLKLSQQNLFVSILFLQIILFSSYAFIIKNFDNNLFWGRITNKNYKNYFLMIALIAYILNLCLYFYFVFKQNIKDEIIYKVFLTLLIYYGLQLYFLPSTLIKNKIYTRILLGICILPILYLFYITLQHIRKITNIYEKIFLYIASILPLLHVFMNDFLLYSFSL
jgi:hypothetical protein